MKNKQVNYIAFPKGRLPVRKSKKNIKESLNTLKRFN